MGTILLFYKYIEIKNPQAVANEQMALCAELGIKGRILIAQEGINGTIGGSLEATNRFKEYLGTHELFFDMNIKESKGIAEHFPRLQVTVKKQIVNFGPHETTATPGTYLTPQEAHDLMQTNPADLVIFDARNSYESSIGAFENAIKPSIAYFREITHYIDEHSDQFKNKKVLMYCTGGIRCEKATAYLKDKQVASEVFHIKGGIHRYIEQFPNGLFKGKNYVFDGRVAQQVTDDILAQCERCKKAYDDYSNCINAECNKQIIVCPECIGIYHNTCSEQCMDLVRAGKVNIRTIPYKTLIRVENSNHGL